MTIKFLPKGQTDDLASTGSGDGLALNRCQVITCTNDDLTLFTDIYTNHNALMCECKISVWIHKQISHVVFIVKMLGKITML